MKYKHQKAPTVKSSVRKTSSSSVSRSKASPDSGISEPVAVPQRTNGFHDNDDYENSDVVRASEPVREADQTNPEEELPERGFTRSLLAQWQTKMQDPDSSVSSGGRVASPRATSNGRGGSGGGGGGNVTRSWSYKQRSSNTEQRHEEPAATPQPSLASQQAEMGGDQGGVSENKPERLDNVVRETDNNEEDYLPPASYTKNMLAKFQSMQSQQNEPAFNKPKQKVSKN